MSDDTMDADGAVMDDGIDLDALPKKKMSGKKLVLFILLPVLLLGGAGAGVYFSGILGGSDTEEVAAADEGEDYAAADEEKVGPGVFYDLPDLLVNLNDAGNQPRFLKISISLELPTEEEVAPLEAVMPRVIDHFQTYLRELRVDDLRGSAGVYRLRQELRDRVASAAAPVRVDDVLFREILIQ